MLTFQLYNSIRIIKGASHSLLIDTQKSRLFRFNAAFSKILFYIQGKSVSEINTHSLTQNISSFIHELIELELGNFTDDGICDTAMQFQDYSLGEIENAIVEFDLSNYQTMKDIVQQLIASGCKFLEIRIVDSLTMELIDDLLSALDSSIVSGITLMLKYGQFYTRPDILRIMNGHYRVHDVFLFNASQEIHINLKIGQVHYFISDLKYQLCGGYSGHADPPIPVMLTHLFR